MVADESPAREDIATLAEYLGPVGSSRARGTRQTSPSPRRREDQCAEFPNRESSSRSRSTAAHRLARRARLLLWSFFPHVHGKTRARRCSNNPVARRIRRRATDTQVNLIRVFSSRIYIRRTTYLHLPDSVWLYRASPLHKPVQRGVRPTKQILDILPK